MDNNTYPAVCDVCGVVFDRAELLQAHKLDQHTELCWGQPVALEDEPVPITRNEPDLTEGFAACLKPKARQPRSQAKINSGRRERSRSVSISHRETGCRASTAVVPVRKPTAPRTVYAPPAKQPTMSIASHRNSASVSATIPLVTSLKTSSQPKLSVSASEVGYAIEELPAETAGQIVMKLGESRGVPPTQQGPLTYAVTAVLECRSSIALRLYKSAARAVTLEQLKLEMVELADELTANPRPKVL